MNKKYTVVAQVFHITYAMRNVEGSTVLYVLPSTLYPSVIIRLQQYSHVMAPVSEMTVWNIGKYISWIKKSNVILHFLEFRHSYNGRHSPEKSALKLLGPFVQTV